MKKIFISFVFIFIFCQISYAKISVVIPEYVYQGGSFKVKVFTTQEVGRIYAEFKNRKARLYPWGEFYCGVVGTMPEEKPGQYSVKVKIDGIQKEFIKKIKVKRKYYPKVSFFVPRTKKKLLSRNLIAEEWAKVEKTLIKENPKKYWGEKFHRPISGIVTMGYGVREFINNKLSGRHRGVDYRAKIGTIVRAPCSGKVVFAEHLKAFGGTMVIDHGQGVQSIFFHLSKFLVEAGVFVEKGRKVAKTGNSGISSGPHLHYGLSVNNVRVDPTLWINPVSY